MHSRVFFSDLKQMPDGRGDVAGRVVVNRVVPEEGRGVVSILLILMMFFVI